LLVELDALDLMERAWPKVRALGAARAT